MPSRPGKRTRSVMFAWSSLSRTSHFSSRGDDDTLGDVGLLLDPVVEARLGAGDHREERVLVDDARVERRRLDEEDEVVAVLLEVAEGRRELVEQLGREEIRALPVERRAQLARQLLVRPDVVDAPHDSVPVVLLAVVGREVQGDVRRVRPVEEARRQAVMLAQREPVPRRVVGHRVLHRVLPEGAHQLALELGVAAEPHEPAPQVGGGVGGAAIREARAEEPELVVPRIGEQELLQLEPRSGTSFLHRQSFRRSTRSCVGFPRAPSGSSSRNVKPCANVSRR